VSPKKEVERIETGRGFEQAVELKAEGGQRMPLRRIELQLDEPTEDGDTCVRLLTNVPAERIGGQGGSRTVPTALEH